MNLPFTHRTRGCVGIALIDGGATVAQGHWDQGSLDKLRGHRIEGNPRDFEGDQWRSATGKAGTRGAACVLSIPASMTTEHVLRIPAMPDAETREAASWEVAERLGVAREDIQVDAIRIGDGAEVMAVAADPTIIRNILEPIYTAGLRPTAIEPQQFAIARLFGMRYRRAADRSSVRAILDIGRASATMLVLTGDRLSFSRQLRSGGQSLVDAVSSNVGVDPARAAQLLDFDESSQQDPVIEQAIARATRATHEEMAAEAVACLRHFGVTSRGNAPQCLILTGSASRNRHLADVLSRSCSMRTTGDDMLFSNPSAMQVFRGIDGWQAAIGASMHPVTKRESRRRRGDGSERTAA